MCGSVDELKARASWDGTHGGSRHALLCTLQRHIPPSLLLPEERLLTLLQQAVLWQTSQGFEHQTFSHGAGGGPGGPGGVGADGADGGGSSCSSLFEDFSCSRDVLPRETRHVLEEHHADEVWCVAFSHGGAHLASAAKDGTVVVWDVATMAAAAVLAGHTDAPTSVAWSPDDTRLLTGGADRRLKLWDVASARCVATLAQHTESVTVCAWLPDGRHFVSAGIDKFVHLWDGSDEDGQARAAPSRLISPSMQTRLEPAHCPPLLAPPTHPLLCPTPAPLLHWDESSQSSRGTARASTT